MNDRKNEKWLDELIARTIDSGKPQFDSEKWKEKYHEEFKILLSRAEPASQPKTRWLRVACITAIAASVILLFCLFSISITPENKITEVATSARYILPDNEHIVTEIDTSPLYILAETQNNHLKETKPCDILPLFPN